jgi:hypothetical protein
MNLSKLQNDKIRNEVDRINPMITDMKEGLKIAQDRLKKLHDVEFHIEALILNG